MSVVSPPVPRVHLHTAQTFAYRLGASGNPAAALAAFPGALSWSSIFGPPCLGGLVKAQRPEPHSDLLKGPGQESAPGQSWWTLAFKNPLWGSKRPASRPPPTSLPPGITPEGVEP